MSERDRTADPGDCGSDAAAYVLDALEPEEAERFRDHLRQCAVCRDEVASLQAAADALPMAVPQVTLPRGVRRRILAEAHRDARRRPTPVRLPRWRPATAGAAALVLAAGALTAVELSTGGGTATRVIAARVLSSNGSAQVRIRDGGAVLVVRQFPAPPSGKIYEVWLKHPGSAPQPTAALFSVTADGSGDVAVPGNLKGVRQVLVTPEPLGGSVVPTHVPVIEASLGA
jgi:anti-sigma-K factor RskA